MCNVSEWKPKLLPILLCIICVLLLWHYAYPVSATQPPTAETYDADESHLATSESSSSALSWKYALVVDAGSTGSRIHVYKYKPTSPLITISYTDEEYKKFRPGLSYHATDPEAAGTSLKDLVAFGREKVPQHLWKTTPLFLFATAGMRKVREQNPHAAKRILLSCFSFLSGTVFVTRKEWVRIIDGKDEGLWGWMTANYLDGSLENLLSQAVQPQTSTRGVLEMGGESVQITFIPSPRFMSSLSETDKGKYVTKRSIGGKVLRIYTHSYMGFGMEAAQKKYDSYLNSKLSQEGHTDGKDRKKSPCYLTGSKRARETGKKLIFEGQGEFSQCYEGVSKVITKSIKSGDCPVKIEIRRCSMDNVPVPNLDNSNPFYLIENFYYTAHVVGLQNATGKEYVTQMESMGRKFCQLKSDKVKETFKDVSEDEIQKTCFATAYLVSSLRNGFGIGLSDSPFTNFKVIRSINEANLDWPLGFLVEHSGDLDTVVGTPRRIGRRSSMTLWVYVLICGCLCYAGHRAGVVERLKKRICSRGSSRGYQPLSRYFV